MFNSRRNRLSQIEIIEAIGNGKGFTRSKKRRFSQLLRELVLRMINAENAPYPPAAVLKDFVNDLKQLDKIVSRIIMRSSKHNFNASMLGLVGRELTDYGYRLVELEGVQQLARIASHNANTARFKNVKAGTDDRYAYNLACSIAMLYLEIFKEEPKITGKQSKGDGTYIQTPYQRICDVIAKHTRTRIGFDTQKDALDSLVEPPINPYAGKERFDSDLIEDGENEESVKEPFLIKGRKPNLFKVDMMNLEKKS